MGPLQGNVAIVTGASKGIGAAIATAFAVAGARVVVNYASSKEGADRIVVDIASRGGDAIAVQADVSKVDDVKRLFAVTHEAYGRLDVLVNNAGVFEFHPLEDVTEQEFHREFNTNVLGTILAAREALAYFGPEGGAIINLSSVASAHPAKNSVVYAATKGAVDAITRELATELGPRKIRVNAIAPGEVDTEGVRRVGLVGTDREKEILAQTPLGRVGQPDDIAKIAVFLASKDAGWVSGERITAAGGWR